MKKTIKLIAILFAMLPAICSAQNAKAPVWAEMKSFHKIMSGTFHPAEEGNFVPLREKADSMLIIAKAWAASTIPSNFKADETKAALEKLVKECQHIQESVSDKLSNEKLNELIIQAHETFHNIVGECKKADE